MVCMGGPSITITWNPTAGHRIDSGTTVCCAQYITPWPLTHPCCAPAFFSFSVDCERRQRRDSFLFSLTKHYVIRHPSEIFQFLLIVVGPSFFQLSGFVIVNHGSGIEMVQKPVIRCTKGANARLTSKLIRKQRCEQHGVLRTNQKCRPLYILLLPSLRDQQWVWFCHFVLHLSEIS